MKKKFMMGLVVVFVVGLTGVVFAQGGSEMPAKEAVPGMKEGMSQGMTKKDGGMMGREIVKTIKHKMSIEMVTTSDGGVIVLAGNKLMKYDKDLNLLKEVTIEAGMDAMKDMMKTMKCDCPMMPSAEDSTTEQGEE